MKKPSTNKIIFRVFLGLCLIAIAGMIALFVFYNSNIDAVDKNDNTTIIFEIELGETISTLAPKLLAQDLISSEFVFKIAAKVANNTNVQAGTYYLNKTMSVMEILEHINNPTNAVINEVQVTITEGSWAKDAANLIAKQCQISSDALLALWNDETYIRSLMSDYWFINEDIFEAGKRVLLEGFIYPNTYNFYYDATAEEITEKILSAYAEVLDPLEQSIENFELSLYDTITLASIVEFESGNVDDMQTIAGVFMNRLHDDMPLQSSVTICYTLYNYKDARECELGVNAQIDSPYNTYVYSGLPLGPILNPSAYAIDAVLNYATTDYYYFIGADGTTYYAKTYDEHLANVENYLR
ncbi:MAG: endolytic transglycosylase MltG [Erysipelotrichaceae bacterium]